MKLHKILFPKEILVLLVPTVALILFRMITGTPVLGYLLWNIFLAALPFVVSAILLFSAKEKRVDKKILILGGIIWLFLIPNAPYMITDLVHITEGHSTNFFYNAIIFFSSAWVGLLFGLHSFSHIEQIVRMKYSQKKTSRILVLLIFLTSFGICLGRFFRFNSWDMIAQPLSLFKNIFSIFSYPQLYTHVYLLTIAFFIFLLCAYYAWKSREKEREKEIEHRQD
jgi:uncharacterized membrane protein